MKLHSRAFSSGITGLLKTVHPPLLKKGPGAGAKISARRPVPCAVPPFDTVEAFLKPLRRGLVSHAAKFSSWKDFFTSNSRKMDKLGINIRERRFILGWQNKFRYLLSNVDSDSFRHTVLQPARTSPRATGEPKILPNPIHKQSTYKTCCF